MHSQGAIRRPLVVLLTIVVGVQVSAYRDATHHTLAERAVDFAENIYSNFFDALGYDPSTLFGGPALYGNPASLTGQGWVREGAVLEDTDRLNFRASPALPGLVAPIIIDKGRPIFHFFEPFDQRGLDRTAVFPIAGQLISVTSATSARNWAITGNGLAVIEVAVIPTAITSRNEFSYREATRYFFEGLTETTESVRRQRLARMFRSLGHVVHLLQDSAQPQHVRNDIHTDVGFIGHKSVYEYFVEE